MAGQDVFEELRDLPFRRFALAQLNRANDLVQKLGGPVNFDQYPGKEEPAAFSCIYGPIGMRATRHVAGATGFSKLAPLVTPTTPFLPRDTNPLTGHDYSFYWTDTLITGAIAWSYTSAPGGGLTVPVAGKPLGDIFDPALEDNGGAQVWQNFSQAFPTEPRICFELDFFDKKKGRSMTDGRVPGEIVMGCAYERKPTFGPTRWEPDTEIEPRLYITEVKMTDALDTDAAYNAADVAVYLNLSFNGYFAFDAHPSAAFFNGDERKK